jgi:glycosyltransferase involved in cell wall biosynthesis
MITILYPVNELKIGGAEQQLLDLVRGLDKSRFRPIVAPLYPNGSLDGEFRAVPGVEVVDLNRSGKYDPSPLWRIGALLRRHQIEIVQPFLSPATFFSLLPAMAVGGSAMIVTERCGIRKNRRLGYKIYRTVEDWVSHCATVIVSNSYAGQELLLQRGLPDSMIRVIYNGVNQERLVVDPDAVNRNRATTGVPADGVVIGILASLTPAKGHDTLLRAFAIVTERFPGARLAIVGDGPRRHALEALTAELGLTRQVVFFGYQRNVADFLASFDLLVSASTDNEGCSNSILEAMSLGVPVVATDVGGNRELVRHLETGLLVPVADPSLLAGAMTEALESPHLSSAIAQRAREMISNQFGLERMVHDYESLYVNLLAASGEPVVDADGRMVTVHR